MSAEVIPANVIPLLKITTVREALDYGDGWKRQYHRLEVALHVVTAQLDASELLLKLAEEELAKYRS